MASAVYVLALVSAALVAAWVIRSLLVQRNVVRRLESVAARLEGGGQLPGSRRIEAALTTVEQAAERSVEEAGLAAAAAERLRQVLRGVHQGVIVCDENGEMVFRNPPAAGLAEARHADVLVDQEIDELLREALRGQDRVRTLELYGPPRRTLLLSAFPLDDGQRLIGAAAAIEDVSERRRVDAMRRDFVANISHELKTPVGALGLLAETLAAEDDPLVAKRLAERVQSEAFRMGRVIDDLLDLTRIEAEETPVREPVAVHLVMAEAVERVRPAAQLRGVTVEVSEPPHPQALVGDRRQLVSALFNLVENAVKYSEPGSVVEVNSKGDGAWVDLVVRDHGIGIPARDLERIFERFYRVDRGRSRETGGTGLGLAIVRHVATNHGGEVRVESHEGEGSTFTLRLPAAPGTSVAGFGTSCSALGEHGKLKKSGA